MPRSRLSPAATDASSSPFAWGCIVRDNYHFTYIYGATPACALAVVALPAGEYLNKGGCGSLLEARTRAQEAAAHLQEVYAGVGSSRALPVGAFVRERGRDREREMGHHAVTAKPQAGGTRPAPAGRRAAARSRPGH